MLGSDSVVLRVNPDGSLVPFEQMPSLFFQRPIRQVLGQDSNDAFHGACSVAISDRTPVAFQPNPDLDDEILINPILDDTSDDCRFLICWVRGSTTATRTPLGKLTWADLRLDQVTTRFRRRMVQDTPVVEAAPWWALTGGELLELWPHHSHVSAMGLGHAVMESLITDAAEAAASGGGLAVRLSVPSADMLAGLIPVFHGAVRASGLDPEKLIVAIPVALAADEDLLPIIVHLRTMGMRIDIEGLDALTSRLHMVSDTSSLVGLPVPVPERDFGPWVDTFAEAVHPQAA